MKLTKVQIKNGIWILAIGLILFTPIAFHFRVWIIGQISSHISAGVVEKEERMELGDYQWQLVDLDGNPMDFRSLKGEVVLVNVWATWCPPCVAEFPSFVKLHRDYGEKVAFLFVARDEPEKVKAFLERKGYGLPAYFEVSNPPREFSGSSIPATYIIGRTGKIAVDEKGAANWNSRQTRELLDALLLEPYPLP